MIETNVVLFEGGKIQQCVSHTQRNLHIFFSFFIVTNPDWYLHKFISEIDPRCIVRSILPNPQVLKLVSPSSEIICDLFFFPLRLSLSELKVDLLPRKGQESLVRGRLYG